MASIEQTGETGGNLIAASRVNGTSVYDQSGTHIGSIDDLMINKRSGQVAYAVLSFGGFLGIGDRHHPLPWETLRYDPELGGYVTNIDRNTLVGGPSYADHEAIAWDDEAWGRRLHDYYGPRAGTPA